MLVVNQQHPLAVGDHHVNGQVNGQRGCADTALDAVERDDASQALRPLVGQVARLKTSQGLGKMSLFQRLRQKLIAAGAHGTHEVIGFYPGRHSDQVDAVVEDLLQPFDGQQGEFSVAVTVHNGNA